MRNVPEDQVIRLLDDWQLFGFFIETQNLSLKNYLSALTRAALAQRQKGK